MILSTQNYPRGDWHPSHSGNLAGLRAGPFIQSEAAPTFLGHGRGDGNPPATSASPDSFRLPVTTAAAQPHPVCADPPGLVKPPRRRRAVSLSGVALEESNLHGTFAKHRVHGEWFKPHPDIMRWIKKFRASPTAPVTAISVAADLLEFFSEVTMEETEDGTAARQLMRRFVGNDEVRSVLFAAREIANRGAQ